MVPPSPPLSRTIWSKEQRGPRAFLHISCWIKCATLLCSGMQTLAPGRSLYASKNSKKSPSVLCGVQSSSHEFQSKCMHGVVHGARVQRKTLKTELHHLLFSEIQPCRRVENYIWLRNTSQYFQNLNVQVWMENTSMNSFNSWKKSTVQNQTKRVRNQISIMLWLYNLWTILHFNSTRRCCGWAHWFSDNL